jgi:hypothetical protein
LLFLSLGTAQVSAAPASDLRDLAVGTHVSDLPVKGYTGFVCAELPNSSLDSWGDWNKCPANQSGQHVVGFRYDDRYNQLAKINKSASGTIVAGHPAVLTLGVDPRSQLVSFIRIATDPKAPRFLRKRAFLFGSQAKARFGDDGWNCVDGMPEGGFKPIGGVFLDQQCEKVTKSRRFVVHTALYAQTGTEPERITNEAILTIEAPSFQQERQANSVAPDSR